MKRYLENADLAQYSHFTDKERLRTSVKWLEHATVKRDNTKTRGLSFPNVNQVLFPQLYTEEALSTF